MNKLLNDGVANRSVRRGRAERTLLLEQSGWDLVGPFGSELAPSLQCVQLSRRLVSSYGRLCTLLGVSFPATSPPVFCVCRIFICRGDADLILNQGYS